MTKIDIAQLRREIRLLDRHQLLYRVLKEELGRLGYWKNRPRGDPVKAYRCRGKSRLVSFPPE